MTNLSCLLPDCSIDSIPKTKILSIHYSFDSDFSLAYCSKLSTPFWIGFTSSKLACYSISAQALYYLL
jgi:hypothetical protein